MNKTLTTFTDGLLKFNPVFVLLLGMCSTLATTTNVINGIGMGLSTTFVLVMSNFFVSLVRKMVPETVRIACYIVIIAGFVGLIDMLLKAYFPTLSASLGVFIPLIAANCILLARAEVFASKNNVFLSFLDGLGSGLGFTWALALLASVREVLGNGTFAGIPLFGGHYEPITIMILPPGGFIALGILLTIITIIKDKAGVK